MYNYCFYAQTNFSQTFFFFFFKSIFNFAIGEKRGILNIQLKLKLTQGIVAAKNN